MSMIGQPILAPDAHVQARHEREVERHVELVAVAEVGAHVLRPLVGLGQQHAVAAVLAVDDAPKFAQDGVGLGQVLAAGALALDQVGHGVAAEAVEPAVEPEAHDVQHRARHGRVVVVEVGLVAEEAVPVVLLGDRVPRPVRLLGVGEDDAGVAVALVGVAPDVVVAVGRRAVGPGRLEPGVLVGGVVHDQVGDHPQAAVVGGVEELLEVVDGAVRGVDAVEVGDVVAVVLQRRGVHRQDPQAVDAELPHVVELRGQAGEVADAVAVGVEERLHVNLVEDRVLVPVLHAASLLRARRGAMGPPPFRERLLWAPAKVWRSPAQGDTRSKPTERRKTHGPPPRPRARPPDG